MHVFSLQRFVIGAQIRRSAAKHQGRPCLPAAVGSHIARVVLRTVILLLVAALVLLVHNHQAQILKGCKDRAAHANQHPGAACAHAVPNVTALILRKLAVCNSDVTAKPCLKALDKLRCKRNFGHQHQHLPAAGDNVGRRTQVHLRLAAACDALQQKALRPVCIRRLVDLLHRQSLLFCQLQAGTLLLHLAVAVTQHTLLHCHRQAVLRQGTRYGRTHAFFCQLAYA